jgi:alcohol dehydrogenase class IV
MTGSGHAPGMVEVKLVELSGLRKFVAPEVIFGNGARFLAGSTAVKYGVHHVMIVTDPGVIAAGWTKDVLSSLEEVGIDATINTNVSPNPRDTEVMQGRELFLENDCDAIIAVGGGSVIDCAKGIGIVRANNGDISLFEGADLVEVPMPPLICIPTTGGTSADVSQFAIISSPEGRRKFAIISKSVVPDVALIDPETLTTMDAYLTACTGMDALVHAIEAFVSLSNSPLTDLHALHAIKLLRENLEESVRDLANMRLRSAIMQASFEAGLAFSNASLGATHAMSHSLGGALDLAHGECNAMLLSPVVEFNFLNAPERYMEIAKALGLPIKGLTTSEAKAELLKDLIEFRRRLGIDKTLSQVGVRTSDIPQLVDNALGDICLVTNPRRPSRRDLEVIYEESI